jgi:hypothetical protein
MEMENAGEILYGWFLVCVCCVARNLCECEFFFCSECSISYTFSSSRRTSSGLFIGYLG